MSSILYSFSSFSLKYIRTINLNSSNDSFFNSNENIFLAGANIVYWMAFFVLSDIDKADLSCLPQLLHFIPLSLILKYVKFSLDLQFIHSVTLGVYPNIFNIRNLKMLVINDRAGLY